MLLPAGDHAQLIVAIDDPRTGLPEEVGSVGLAGLVHDHDPVAVRERLPVGGALARVLMEAIEELAVVELESHVVRDASAELGDLEEHPVREAVRGVDAVTWFHGVADGLDRVA